MKQKFARLLVTCLFIFGIVQCAQKEHQEEPVTALANWHSKMHVLSGSLSRLLPLSYSPQAFNDPKNRSIITDEVRTIKSIAHSIDKTNAKPDHDPAMVFMAQRFSSNMDEVLDQIENKSLTYARRLIQQSTAYCISCHTRTDEGRSNLQLSSLANVDRLTRFQQVDFFIAVRDFDKALSKFDEVVNSPDAQIQSPYDMEALAEKALAIAVRVKRDPALADEMVNRVIEARWAPVYLRLNALAWKKSIGEWRKAKPFEQLNAKDQLELAKELIAQADQSRANSPVGHSGLVNFLRSSTILHNLLGQSPTQPRYGEALFYAGLAAESLRDMNLWTLHEAYYEACIRHSPRSRLAKKCYLRLEALQYVVNASGDSAAMPRNVRERLSELKNLSQEKDDQLNNWNYYFAD